MTTCEVVHAELAEEVPVRGIGERVGRREMGYRDVNNGARETNAMNFLHRFWNVGEVLETS
jgi:hypothetical protein